MELKSLKGSKGALQYRRNGIVGLTIYERRLNRCNSYFNVNLIHSFQTANRFNGFLH